MNKDKLDFDFINSLGLFYGSLSGTYWLVLDMCVETGLTRIDVCGKMQICDIIDFSNFKDEAGRIYDVDDFYLDGDRALSSLEQARKEEKSSIFTAYVLQFAAMAVDILVIFALFTVFKISFFIGLIFFAIAHSSMKATGGWFFAWKKENIKSVFNNLKSNG